MTSAKTTIDTLSSQMRKAVRIIKRPNERSHLTFVTTLCTEVKELRDLPGLEQALKNPLFKVNLTFVLNRALQDVLEGYNLATVARAPLVVHALKVI